MIKDNQELTQKAIESIIDELVNDLFVPINSTCETVNPSINPNSELNIINIITSETIARYKYLTKN